MLTALRCTFRVRLEDGSHLAGRFCQSGARFGINVCARGAIWDLGGNDCPAFVVSREKAIETGRGKPALNNLWLQ